MGLQDSQTRACHNYKKVDVSPIEVFVAQSYGHRVNIKPLYWILLSSKQSGPEYRYQYHNLFLFPKKGNK